MVKEIIRILKEKGILKDEQVQSLPPASLLSIGSFEAELIKRGLARDEDIVDAKSEILNIPSLELAQKEISPEVLGTVPENTVLRYKFAPIEKKGNELIIGMVDPEDIDAREALKFIVSQEGLTPKIYIISLSDLQQISRQYRTLGKEVGSALRELEEELEKERAKKAKKKSKEEIEEISAQAPITKVVAVIIRHAVVGEASDIHIEPMEEKTRVRFRVDGVMHSSIFLPSKTHEAIIARIKIISRLKIDERRIPQDGRFQTTIGDKKIDFRVSTLPTAYGEKAVMRILDPSAGVTKFEDLGLMGRNLKVYKEAIKKPFGLVLITGPTGSGKSTTLYTTLNGKNSEEVNIVTLEDPIEYYIKGVNQSQIRPDIKFSFASGLRSVVRQDPDIIMVGEIRDEETAMLVTHAALTGHLVFSTLHTNDALGIIPRLVNMGVESYLIPPTLVAGAAQRLVKKLCQDCLTKVQPTASQREIIDKTIVDISKEELAAYGIKEPYTLYKSKGCPDCGGTGTKGRIAIYEVFEMTDEFEGIILQTFSEVKMSQEAKRQGMITMKQDGIMKALIGLVSVEEVLRVVEQ